MPSDRAGDDGGAFTPGPWSFSHRAIPGDKDGMYATQVYDGDGVEIATAAWYQVRGTRCVSTNREANARLIAAAPDLLAALQAIQWFCDDPNGSDSRETLAEGLARLLPDARAAIAKALPARKSGACHDR